MAHKAFVSSTFEDLKAHRQAVIATLRRAGIFVDPMEEWTASSAEPKVFSRDRLRDCDLCVLLVGFRRGHIPKGEESSITQLEYQAAVAGGIDVLVFMLQEDVPWSRKFNELDEDPGIRKFRAELKESKGVSFFGVDPNSLEIASSLARWFAEKTATSHTQIRKEAATRLRTMQGRLSKQPFFHEIYGLSQIGGEKENEPSTWSLSRLILEGWGDEAALNCHYEELSLLVLSNDAAEDAVAAAEERLEAVIQTLGITVASSSSVR